MVECEVGGFCISKTLKTFLPSFLLHCELLEERDYVLFIPKIIFGRRRLINF